MVLIIDFKVVTSGINLNLNHSIMKPYLAPIFHKLFLLLLFCTFGMLISCSEDEDDLVLTETVSLKFTSPLPDVVDLGENFSINISSNADQIEVEFAKKDKPDSLFNKMVLNKSEDQFSLTVDVPADSSWTGNNLITITAIKGAETMAVTREVVLGYEDKIDEGDGEEEGPVRPEALFLVGGSSEAGWEPTAALPLTRREKDGNVYHEIYTFLSAGGGGFKILPTQADWEGGYGLEDGELSNSGGAGNFEIDSDGFYRISFLEDDEAPLGFTYEVIESNWGIIGAATPGGWDGDTDMEAPASVGDYTWTITLDLFADEFKFRENDDWPVNFGAGAEEGVLAFDGANLSVSEAGNYTISIDFNPEGYTYLITKN